MNKRYTFRFVYPSNMSYECMVVACSYETALKQALVEAHRWAKSKNIPYYRVEG